MSQRGTVWCDYYFPTGVIMGHFLFFASGLVMLVFEVVWFYRWWDVGGVVASILIPPLAAVFPFIYLVKEGFSALYFGIWAVGLLGVLIASRQEA